MTTLDTVHQADQTWTTRYIPRTDDGEGPVGRLAHVPVWMDVQNGFVLGSEAGDPGALSSFLLKLSVAVGETSLLIAEIGAPAVEGFVALLSVPGIVFGILESPAGVLLLLTAAALLLVYMVHRTGFSMPAAAVASGMMLGPHAAGLISGPVVAHAVVEGAAWVLFGLEGFRLGVHPPIGLLRQARTAIGKALLLVGALALLIWWWGGGAVAGVLTGLLFWTAGLSIGCVVGSRSGGRHPESLAGGSILVFLLLPVLTSAGREGVDAVGLLMPTIGLAAVVLLFNRAHTPAWLGHVRERLGSGRAAVGASALGAALVLTAWAIDLGVAVGLFLAGLMLSRGHLISRRTADGLRTLTGIALLIGLGAVIELQFLTEHPVAGLAAIAAIAAADLVLRSRTEVGTRALRRMHGSLTAAALCLLIFYGSREAGVTPYDFGLAGDQLLAVSLVFILLVVVPLALRIRGRGRPGRLHRDRPDVPTFQEVIDSGLLTPEVRSKDSQVLQASAWARRAHEGGGTCDEAPRMRMVTVEHGACADDVPLHRLKLWERHQLILMAVWRHDACITNPAESFKIRRGDRLLLTGSLYGHNRSADLFRASP